MVEKGYNIVEIVDAVRRAGNPQKAALDALADTDGLTDAVLLDALGVEQWGNLPTTPYPDIPDRTQPDNSGQGAPSGQSDPAAKPRKKPGPKPGARRGKTAAVTQAAGTQKGVKADPRRTAKAAGFTILHLPLPGGIRAGRPRPMRQAQQEAVPPLVVPAPEGYIWAERPCYLLQSPLFRRQQVPIPHGRGWVSTPAECRDPKAASRPRPDSPGRKMGAPWELYRTIASRRVQSAYLPARKFGRGGLAKGHPPPPTRRDAEGPVCGRQTAAGISHPAAAGANSGGLHQREENRMNFVEKMDETRSSVAQITCWCIAIALHQEHGVGAKRLNRLTDKLDELQEQNTRTMTREGTRAADQERAAWIGGKAPLEFPVPVMRAPKNRKEKQYRMAGNEAAGIAWQLYAAACIEVLGFGPERLCKLWEEARDNYRQVNGWAADGGMEYALTQLKRCAELALREKLRIVDEDPMGWNELKEELRREKDLALRVRMSKAMVVAPCAAPPEDKQGEIFARCMAETLANGRAR